MLPIIIALLIGCLLGVILIAMAIITRKRIRLWVVVLMAIVGISIIIECGIMLISISFITK